MKKGVTISINFKKSHLFVLLVIIVVFAGFGIVVAYSSDFSSGDPVVMGHSSDEVNVNLPSGVKSLQQAINDHEFFRFGKVASGVAFNGYTVDLDSGRIFDESGNDVTNLQGPSVANSFDTFSYLGDSGFVGSEDVQVIVSPRLHTTYRGTQQLTLKCMPEMVSGSIFRIICYSYQNLNSDTIYTEGYVSWMAIQ